MPGIQTSLPIPTQPWERAQKRFLDGLSDGERHLYEDASLENIFYDASAEQKRFARGSRASRLLDLLSPIIESIEDYGKAMDVFVNTAPLVLSPLWGSIRVLIHIAGEAAKFQEQLIEMLSEIGEELPRYCVLQKVYSNHEALLVAISSVYLEVLQFCVATKEFFLRARRSKLPLSIVLSGMWKSHRRQFTESITQLRKKSKHVKKEAGLAHYIEGSNSQEVERQNRALQLQHIRMRRRNLILSSLAVVDYVAKQSRFATLRHPGTCKWLQRTSAYKSWIQSTDSGCMCCYGIPGAGKSILAASLRDDLLDANTGKSDVLICYYFCDYAEISSLDPAYILLSLIKQALEQLPWDIFEEDFECPYVETGRKHTSLTESSKYLCQLLRRFTTTYMIIDGVDELSHENQTHMLDFLNQLQGSAFTVKIFVTSRTEEYRIKKALQTPNIIRLSEKHVDSDIALLINDKLGELEDQHPILLDSKLKQEVIKALVNGAKGMFLWVRFQLYDIEEALTPDAIRTALANLPKTLTETYQRIIDKTVRDPGGQEKANMMTKVFCWLAVAQRPLHVRELEEAVAIDPSDTYLHVDRVPRNAGERLVSACSNLAMHNVEDDTVVFAHHTVKQFFCSSASNAIGTTSIFIEVSKARDDIGEMCLAYLSFSDFETQLTKLDSKVFVNQRMTNDMVWYNVPFGSRIRRVVRSLPFWRRGVASESDYAMALALPAAARPSGMLVTKYSLLEYIIEFWIFHTAHLRPDSSSWAKYRRTAMHQQLPFEFRPWNSAQHQDKFRSFLGELSLAASSKGHRSSPLATEKARWAMFSWALKYALGSVLALLKQEDIEGYFALIQQAHTPPGTLPHHSGPRPVLEALQNLTAAATPILAESSLGGASQAVWSGGSLKRLLRISLDMRQSIYNYLVVEFSHSFGPEFWNQLAMEGALHAMRCGDEQVFKCIYDGYLDTPQVPHKSVEQLRVTLMGPILFDFDSLDWSNLLVLWRYYSYLKPLTALSDYSTIVKEDNVRQALIVIALLHGEGFAGVEPLATPDPTQMGHRLTISGDGAKFAAEHKENSILRAFEDVDVDSLTTSLFRVWQCLVKEVPSAVEAFAVGAYTLLAHHDCDSMFTLEVYEDSDKYLLQYDVYGDHTRLFEFDWKSYITLREEFKYPKTAEVLVLRPKRFAADVLLSLVLLASDLVGQGSGHRSLRNVSKTAPAMSTFQVKKARWNIRQAVRKL
ncbi:hypothetical protein C7974DRAFT_185964 [Boeremia exigua]|uniref:uncharacterized protein n=1 Tax=Boeremia exigua TaxID=749465 RepID=UPI001E8E6050|nr:uncharacterized protein C7974DRAFT_185964 [Boeremia exigua]KAH6629410.1 hypothetical protein C7974DRAFT_185964 [Boeremia exigua]